MSDRREDPRRIGIDASAVAKAHRTGIGRYIVQLVGALARVDSGSRFDLLYRLSRWKRRRYFLQPPDRRFRIRPLLEAFPFDRMSGLTVAHGPDGRLPRIRGARLVATVHDMFSADSGDYASERFRAKKIARYEEVARRADLVITSSEYGKSRFLAHTEVKADRIRVIPLGVDARFGLRDDARVSAVRSRFDLGAEPYVLYVGQLSDRKNLVRTVEAYSRIHAKAAMVLAGPESRGYEKIENACRRLGLGERVRFLGPVPDEDLPALYQGAAVHLLLSLDEGFGLPVLEAFLAGTPVIASNRGAIPEVAGAAAKLVDPLSVEEITVAMDSLLQDPGLAEVLRGRGRARAQDYSWRRVAERTMDAYREVQRG